ncbi:hypothetical protein LTR85_003107 [Meristemomyces frigidus]|nr:hypothetical protein LTR85_003107 [Meristemomyces frigidus]
MSSAAERAFGIQELFEQIMLDSSVSLERLFVLRRVSKRFKGTIGASFYLQGKMRLRHRTQQEEDTTTPPKDDVLERLLNDRFATRLRIFRGALDINLILGKWTSDGAHLAGTSLGATGQKRINIFELSWSQMRLASSPVVVHLRILNSLALPPGSRHRKLYKDVLAFQPEDSTFGNFYSALQEVVERSIKEHLTLAYAGTRLPIHEFSAEQPLRHIPTRQFAEEKVLTDPELLERILLDLEPKQLFANRRVSPIFGNVINGSSRLGCKMQLHQYDIAETHQSSPIRGEAIRILSQGEVALGGYIMQAPRYNHWEQKSVLSFDLDLSAGYLSPSSLEIGVRKRNQVFNAERHLWRSIKLSPVAGRVDVEIDVLAKKRDSDPRRLSYKEIVEFGGGDGTLGQLAEVLKEVAGRNHEEHCKKAGAGAVFRRRSQA